MNLDITLICHGNDDDHRDRQTISLSITGKYLAFRCGLRLGYPKFDLAIHSSTSATLETAEMVAYGTSEFALIPELFYGSDDPRGVKIEYLQGILGYAPLGAYFRFGAEAAIMSLAQNAVGAVSRVINKSQARNILVVGHAILLPAIGSILADGHSGFVESMVLGPCHGFILQLIDKKAENIIHI
ncbi:MAG: hypothetical protein QOG91_290 [Candidatus Parcubacteria bacterium]|jgi:broad specificity phosphatase PhoE|nr:hypothetical protein [Candidatus Parcubacteria bacterium]